MYDSDATSVMTALQSANPVVFSDATIANILALTTNATDPMVTFTAASPDPSGNVTVASGTEVALVSSSNTFQTTLNAPANAPVLIFQGRGGVVATINDPLSTMPSTDQARVDRVVVGSAGNDRILVQDARNTQVILGTGDSSVQTGRGVDTVQAGLGNSTIVGGSGDYAVVKLAGSASNYEVTSANGHAIVTNMATGKTTDISRVQYVQLDNGEALVFARNSVEGQVAQLYHTAFGRAADAGGLDYWFDLARAGASLDAIASSFVASTEYGAVHAMGETNAQFVESLYQNTFGRAGDDAGVAHWLTALTNGASRASLLTSFTELALQSIVSPTPVEVNVVGSVMVVSGII